MINPRIALAFGLSYAVAAGAFIYASLPSMDKQEKDAIIDAFDHNLDADLRATVDAEIKRRGLTPPAP